jgi:hypothetical protein
MTCLLIFACFAGVLCYSTSTVDKKASSRIDKWRNCASRNLPRAAFIGAGAVAGETSRTRPGLSLLRLCFVWFSLDGRKGKSPQGQRASSSFFWNDGAEAPSAADWDALCSWAPEAREGEGSAWKKGAVLGIE